MSNIDFQALGQAIDTTWGRSSTPQTSAFAVKASLLSDGLMRVDFHTVFNFASDHEMIQRKRRLEEEAQQVIDGMMKQTKRLYKELSGKALSSKKTDAGGNFELAGFGKPSSRKTAHFKYTVMFEIG